MTPQGTIIWSGLEFRRPMLLRNIEPLNEEQMGWIPAPGRNSIAWQLWHIAEVEDNWPRTMILNEPPRFPFGVQLHEARDDQYPAKQELLENLAEVRTMTRDRLENLTDAALDRMVHDPDFGRCTVRDIWAGVVTSFAWHAGQIAMTAKMLPDSPVTTMQFTCWKDE